MTTTLAASAQQTSINAHSKKDFEVDVIIADSEVAEPLDQHFKKDLGRSDPIAPKEIRSSAMQEKLKQTLIMLLEEQL